MIAGCGTLLPTRSMPSSMRWMNPRFGDSGASTSGAADSLTEGSSLMRVG